MMNCQNPMTLCQLCIIMHVEPSGFDFIYNGNIEITNCDLLARNIIVNGNIRMYGQGVINGTSIIKCSGSIHTNGNVIGDIIETKGNIISSSGSVIARNSLKANNIFVKKRNRMCQWSY